jgi:hypothetical protein
MSYYRKYAFSLLLIIIVAWVAHYLHFTQFGLYEDDWFFVAFPFVITTKQWLIGALGDQFSASVFQGRPLQMILGFALTELGSQTGSLDAAYLIAFALFAACAVLMFEVLRHRFAIMPATLATLVLAKERYQAGRFIVLDEVEPGRVVRARSRLAWPDGIVQLPQAARRPTLRNSIRVSPSRKKFFRIFAGGKAIRRAPATSRAVAHGRIPGVFRHRTERVARRSQRVR